jgi:hypothetical protein
MVSSFSKKENIDLKEMDEILKKLDQLKGKKP